MQFDNSTFETFRRSRYEQKPWDMNFNTQYGFGYEHECYTRSDISAHLPMLEFLARQCDYCVEFGSREMFSSIALISGAKKKVLSVDLTPTRHTFDLIRLRDKGELPCEWEFHQGSSIEPGFEIDECCLLFIDTLHNYTQCKAELVRHAHKVRKYLVFHDSFTDEVISYDAGGEGIGRAIQEQIDTGEWFESYRCYFNHGLTVLERTAKP